MREQPPQSRSSIPACTFFPLHRLGLLAGFPSFMQEGFSDVVSALTCLQNKQTRTGSILPITNGVMLITSAWTRGPPALALRTSRRTLSLSVSLTVTLLSVKPLSIQVLIAVPDSLCYQMHSMSSTSMSMAYHDNSRGPEP